MIVLFVGTSFGAVLDMVTDRYVKVIDIHLDFRRKFITLADQQCLPAPFSYNYPSHSFFFVYVRFQSIGSLLSYSVDLITLN